jgi:hypothetical protein
MHGAGRRKAGVGVKIDAKFFGRQSTGTVISIQPWGYVLASPAVRAAAIWEPGGPLSSIMIPMVAGAN